MATIPEALGLARQHHRAGRLREAEKAFRQILQAQPGHPEALHYLGVIAYQVGRHDLAVDYIGKAITLNPQAAEYHNNIGQAYRALGRLDEAVAHYRQALALKPDRAETFSNLGVALKAQGKLDDALAQYRQALALKPAYAEAHFNQGNVLREQGKPEDAIASYRQALALKPSYVEAYNNLGNTLKDRGNLEEAVAQYRQAIALKPDLVEAAINLGIALKDLGRQEESVAQFRHAIALRPTLAEAHNNLGSALKDQGRLEEAAASYRQALALKPAYAEALFNMGNLLREQGKLEEAAEAYRKVLAIAPKDGVRILLATLLPVISDSKEQIIEARRRFAGQVSDLSSRELSLADPVREVGATNFYLSYHGLNDRDLQISVARMYERACPSLTYTAPHCLARPFASSAGKIKIGFVSRFFCQHSIGKSTRGVLANLSRDTFRVYALFVPPLVDDEISRFIREKADETIVLPGDLHAARERIAAEQLDILYYQDIGMDPFTYFLAFSRLSPVQCVRPGHPDATGIAAFDYSISTESAEPECAERHYSEPLVKLKTPVSASFSYYYKPVIPDPLKSRAEFGFDESAHLYICPQTLFKFHPDFDGILSGILSMDQRGRLVLIGGKDPHWAELLLRRFRRTMPHVADRITVLPPQPGRDFINLIALSDVMLDTIHFGGFHTSLEAFAVGTPIVTWPGEFQRGRNTYAFYQAMGLPDCVAKGPEHYVEIAVRLGTDKAYRDDIKARILARNHVLYEDMEVVREFERFFLAAVETARTSLVRGG